MRVLSFLDVSVQSSFNLEQSLGFSVFWLLLLDYSGRSGL